MNRNIDFDLDDPLGDLLSDKSDDSFFEDKKISSNKPSRNSSFDKKKSSLFGLDNQIAKPLDELNSNEIPPSKDDWLGIIQSPVEQRKFAGEVTNTSTEARESTNMMNTKPIPQKATKTKSIFSSDDFLTDLGFPDGNKNVKNKEPLSVNDILKNYEDDNKTDSIIKKETQSSGYNPTKELNKSTSIRIGTPGTLSNKNSGNNKQDSNQEQLIKDIDVKKNKIDLAGRRQKSVDWLGLLGSEEEIIDEPIKEKSVSLSDLLKSHTDDKKEEHKVNIEKSEKKNNATKNIYGTNFDPVTMPDLMGVDLTLSGAKLQMMTDSDIEQQSAAMCLQQQQSQLMVALQLKAQEESLAALHERNEKTRKVQKEIVSAHREQLGQLLKGQAEHRAHIQSMMMEHQKRINQHIQALLRPPSPSTEEKNSSIHPSMDTEDFKTNLEGEREFPYTKSVSAKDQLESIIFNLKENHNKELELLENSYRHQVDLIDQSQTNIEERLKSENENLTNYFLKRIEKLEQLNAKLEEHGEEKIRNMNEKFAAEKEAMEKKHKRDIEILREENQAVINNIKDTVALERSTLRDATGYSHKLESILRDVEKNNTLCSNFANKIDHQLAEDLVKREMSLVIKEKQVTMLLENMENNKVTVEKEFQEMRKNLRHWEERLYIQSKASEEEKLALKSLRNELQNEKEIHARDKENLRIIIDEEQEKMKRNIENIQEKYSNMERELRDKMVKIDQEKVQIEILKRSIEESKTANEEVKRQLDQELNEAKENKKNINKIEEKLHQSEVVLAARYQELETLTQSALVKHSVAERKTSEANFLQQRYEEKIKELQELSLSLGAREQQVARDKVALSRERLLFHNIQKEFHCNSSNINTMIDINKYARSQTPPRIINTNPDYFNSSLPLGMEHGADKMFVKDTAKRSNLYTNNKQWQASSHNASEKPTNHVQLKKLSPLFQEIVDPKLILLKLDLQSSAMNPKTEDTDQD